jgi:transposase
MLASDNESGKTTNRNATTAMESINPNAAGIDVGSQRHYVAVPTGRAENAVSNFGCYTPDLDEMARWLIECGVTTVAMESTGVYWIPVFEVLREHGLEVKLADVRHMKSVPGRKTDVVDCQWIQQLHKALSDISGVSGMRIIRAIVSGEHNPLILASMREAGVKSSEEELMKALSGHYREDHLFTLKQALDLYDIFQMKIKECDQKIQECLSRFASNGSPTDIAVKQGKSIKRRKNQPHFDLAAELYRVTGVDMTSVDGIDAMTAQSIVSEIGFNVDCFPTEKHFASWLALCPNNRITGGKVKKRRSNKSQNRAANALRVAAQSLHHSKSALALSTGVYKLDTERRKQ